MESLCKLGSGESYAAHALYAFDDAGADIALGKLLLPCLKVVDRQIGGVAVGVDWSNDFRVVGHLYCQRCPAVEGLLGRKHAGASRLERCQFQCVLVCLGTTVYQEQLIAVVATGLTQSLCQLLLQLVDDRVGIES